MDNNQAIALLKKNQADKNKQASQEKTNVFAKSLGAFKNILVGTLVDLTEMIVKNEPKVTVKNFPQKTEISNEEIGVRVNNVPEQIRVIIENFPQEVASKAQKKIAKEIELVATEIGHRLDELKPLLLKIPKEGESSRTAQMVRSSNLDKTLNTMLSAIKAIKMSPEVKVNVPQVKVPAPVVNVSAPIVKMPDKINVGNLNLGTLENKIEELITEFKYSAKQGVVISNFDEAPVSTTNTRDLATHAKQDDIITAVNAISLNDVLKDYGLYAFLDDDTNLYVLNENKDGKWIMKRINDTTGVTTYSIGDDDAQQAWIDRATQTFTSYSDTF